ncbi:hypothetical protein VTL71DRAFT_8825 [Oculimacula yallundae]|uniref:Uncharacterized protein n=1 Tax=Oculimacula yallundae TaxID=86028 RepID=A0ABR4CYX3_9HELO
MSANQCGRYPFGILGNPVIYEKFSVCSLRAEGMRGLYDVITKCCPPGSTIRHFQCWNYCAVEESAFPIWLSCVSEAIDTTEGSHCQRADESPVSTATSFPISYQQPVSPAPQNFPSFTTAASTTQSTIPSSVEVSTTQLPTLAERTTPTPPVASRNTSINGTAPPVQVTGSAPKNTKTLELSIGGALCALLALSAFAL